MEINQNLTRREMLKTAAGTSLLLLLPMLAANADDQWTSVGKAAQFVLNQPQRVALASGEVIYITRLSDKDFTAVSAKCTHRGCEVAWHSADNKLECPCHGAEFGASGKNLKGTRRSPDETLPALPTLPIRQQGDQLEVNLAQAAPAPQP